MRGKVLCIVAIILCGAASSSPAGGDKDSGAAVLKKIQGTWKFIAHEMNGKAATPEELAKMTINFKGNKWTVRDGDKVVQAGTHKFNPTKNRGQVDAVVTEGEGKGSTMLGIYEMKGNKMAVCFDPKGKERPTSLKAKEGQMSAAIERVKKNP